MTKLSKVPAVTVFFWVIKVLCTTVGETASDYLNVNLGLGLSGTAVAAGACLLVALAVQFKLDRYQPAIYWLVVVLVSVFGTLVTDILTDSLHFPLEWSTIIFSVALGLTFVAWYLKEGTLSIHSVFTRRRELFYWLAILFTFALGTATGDLVAEQLGVGYLNTGLLVLSIVAAAAVAWRLGLDPVLAFWIAYILTRPLGASLGDYLSQPASEGGLGLGAAATSAIFLSAILAVVVYLAVTRKDRIEIPDAPAAKSGSRPGLQAGVVVAVLLALGITGYVVRSAQLEARAAASTSVDRPLGDLSAFRAIARDMTQAVEAADWTRAKSGASALEVAWDAAQAQLQRMSPAKWTVMDDAIDVVLRQARATSPNASTAAAALQALTAVIDTLDHPK